MRPAGGPLSGLRVVELGGIGPGPFCGMMLADLGAEVIRVDRPGATPVPVLHRGRRSIAIDLKSTAGVDLVLRLVGRADALIEGFRPGVAERLGVGPDVCLARNPRLVYGRMTGWGQDGPLAQEPGHDINYIGLAGALGATGPAGGDPAVPLNLVGDMGGGGMLLAAGILAALFHRGTSGEGQVVDAAMTDGTALQLSAVWSLRGLGRWRDERGVNLLDGGAPFYRPYRCADGRHVAVGCLEPAFYASFLRVLELQDDPLFANQYDESAWPAMAARLTEIFGAQPRDRWWEIFRGQGACVTPVLSLQEAAEDSHNLARETYGRNAQAIVEPLPAPRFAGTPLVPPGGTRAVGSDTDEILAESGLDPEAIADLRARRVVA